MIGCASSAATTVPRVTTTPAERLQWLEAAVARADIGEVVRGAYVPRGTPGAAIVCSLAIQIDAWYGVADERWELTHAASEELSGETMLPARRTRNLREELSRIGIRDCVLDLDR